VLSQPDRSNELIVATCVALSLQLQSVQSTHNNREIDK
jgi:hypothetical protein